MSWALPLLPLAVLPLMLLAVRRERRLAGSPGRRAARLVGRLSILALVGLALGGPTRAEPSALARRRVALVDGALAAVAPVLVEQALAAEAAAAAAAAGEPLELLSMPVAAPRPADGPAPAGLLAAARPVPAGLAGGLSAARAAFGPEAAGRVLLLVSASFDVSDLVAHAARLLDDGLSLEGRLLAPDVAPGTRPEVLSFGVPAGAVRGAFEVRARLAGPPGLRARLLCDGTPLAQVDVPDAPPRELLIEGLECGPGRHLLALVVEEGPPADAAPTPGGSPAGRPVPALAQREIEVAPRPRLLARLEDAGHEAAARIAAVQGFDLEVLDVPGLVARLGAGAAPADALLVDAPSAAVLPEELARLVALRVEQGLGLFVVAGGDAAAWAALAGTPWGALLPCEPLGPLPRPPEPPRAPPPTPPAPPQPPPTPPDRKPGPGRKAERQPEEAYPISLLLVLDRSASMRGQAWAMAVQAAARAADVLSPFDRVGVMTFAQDVQMELSMGPAGQRGAVLLHLPPEATGAGTNIVLALQAAAQVMGRETAAIRHVLLLTDGAHNPTGRRQEEALWTHVRRPLRAAGATLTVVGLGEGQDSFALNEIVQDVRGWSYRRADTPRQVPTVFVVDTLGLAEARSKDARARLPDPEAQPLPAEPAPAEPPEPARTPQPPAPADPAAPPPAAPERPARVRLVLGTPHLATKGLDASALPAVEPPARSGPRAGASVPLLRETGEALLAARRHGVGRVLAFLGAPRDPGLLGWAELPRLYGQGLRSLLAPEGALTVELRHRVLSTPQGDRLLLDRGAELLPAGSRLTWRSGPRVEDLGAVEMAGEEPLALPEAPPGSVAHVLLASAPGEPRPLVTYVAGLGLVPPDPAEARARLERALAALPEPRPLAPPARRVPLGPWLLLAALLLLPLDAWLHARGT